MVTHGYSYPALSADDRFKIWKNMLGSAGIDQDYLNDEDLVQLA